MAENNQDPQGSEPKPPGETPRELRKLVTSGPERLRVVPEITLGAAIKVLAVFFAAIIIMKVWQVFLLILFAAILAAALNPLVSLVERRLARTWAVLAVVALLVVIIVGIGFAIGPRIYQSTVDLMQRAPALLQKVEVVLNKHHIHLGSLGSPTRSAALPAPSAPGTPTAAPAPTAPGTSTPGTGAPSTSAGGDSLSGMLSSGINRALPTVLKAGESFGTAMAGFVIVIIMAIYMLIETPKIALSIQQFVPADRRDSLMRLGHELGQHVGGYVRGQLVACVLAGVFSFAILYFVGVPEATALASIAALMDVLPVIGVVVPMVLATLVALTISFSKAAIVLCGYVVYQQLESHVVIPQVYGRTLQLSLTTVIISVLIGAELIGIPGIVLAMPAAAAIPSLIRFVYEWRMSAQEASAGDTAPLNGVKG